MAAWVVLAVASAAQAAPTLEELQVYVKQHPENVRAVYYLGRMYAQAGNHGQSIRLFMYLLKKPAAPVGSPNVISEKLRMDLLNRIGVAYLKSNDLVRAEKVFTHALRRYPQNDLARRGLELIRKRKGQQPAKVEGAATDADPPKPKPLPPVSPEECKKAFDEGLKLYNQGKDLVDQGNDDGARDLFNQAREKFDVSLRGKCRDGETNYYIGMSYLKTAADDTGELEQARDFLEKAYRLEPQNEKLTPEITFGLASTYGLLDDNENEIKYYERTIELKPNFAEAHFRASLAYDKAKRSDWSAKSFEHAKKAIKLDPNYKKKFQPMIRNSQVAKKVAGIIHEIIQKSEDSQIPDDEAARYAEEIGKVLGDNNIKSEMLGEEGGNSPESLKEMIKDPSKRQKLRQFWDASAGGDPQKVQDMIENATPEQKAKVDQFLSNDRNKQKMQQYLGNKLQEVNSQQE